MADSPSNIQASVEIDEAPAAGELPAALVVVDEDGLPVIDLREPPAADGALVVVDGELVLRLADGTEWPVATSTDAGAVVLQLGDRAFVLAETLKEALGASGSAMTVALLAETGGSDSAAESAAPAPAAVVSTPAAATTGEPAEPAEDEAAADPVSGGAEFRAFVVGGIGDQLQPTMALAPTARDAAGGLGILDDLGLDDGAFAANRPGGGSRFVNLDPQARADLAATTERQAVEIDVLANDRDPNPGDRLKLVKVDGAGLEGEVSITPDGKVVYDPNGKFTHLAVGETATETFSYTVADRHGGQSTAKVTVTVHGVNDAPHAADDRATTTEKAHVVVDLLANDTDPDASDVLRVVDVDAAGLKGDLVNLGDGRFVYDPAGKFTHLGLGQSATETFHYLVSDPHGATDAGTVQIRVNGVNDAPIAHDDLVWISEEGHKRFDALANDVDPDNGDTLRVINLFSLGGSMGQRWINHDGTVTYRPYGAYDYLGQGEIAYQKFGYTVADQHGATDTATITVAIVGLNDAPVAKDDFKMTNEDSAVTFSLLANDHDPDATDSFHIVGLDTSHIKGKVTLGPDGMATYDPNGQFEHLAKDQDAWEVFSYTIADQHGATSTAWVTVKLHGVNDAPVAVDDQFVGYETIGFYAPIEALLANDYDVDSGDTIHFAGLGPAIGGTVALTPDGYVVFTPDAGYTGPAAFQYAIQDQHGAYDIAEVQVDVRPITPGDMSYETASWFAGVSEAAVQTLDNGVTLIDLFVEVGAIAAGALEIGGMPFFSASLSGILQGVISVALLPDGTPLVSGDLAGDLDLQVTTSPIFAPLGGDVYDALYLASGAGGDPFGGLGGPGGGAPSLADLGFGDLLADLVDQVGEAIDLAGVESLVQGLGLGDASALAFGNGVFYLDIAGLISGAVTIPGGHDGEPLIDAELFGEFAAAALFDIRDDLTVVSDGFVDGDFDVAVAPSGIGPGFAISAVVSEEPAMAA